MSKITVTFEWDRKDLIKEIQRGFGNKIRKDVTDKELSDAISCNIYNFFISSDGACDYFRDACNADETEFDDLFEVEDQ